MSSQLCQGWQERGSGRVGIHLVNKSKGRGYGSDREWRRATTIAIKNLTSHWANKRSPPWLMPSAQPIINPKGAYSNMTIPYTLRADSFCSKNLGYLPPSPPVMNIYNPRLKDVVGSNVNVNLAPLAKQSLVNAGGRFNRTLLDQNSVSKLFNCSYPVGKQGLSHRRASWCTSMLLCHASTCYDNQSKWSYMDISAAARNVYKWIGGGQRRTELRDGRWSLYP